MCDRELGFIVMGRFPQFDREDIHKPAQPGVIRPSGETQVISV